MQAAPLPWNPAPSVKNPARPIALRFAQAPAADPSEVMGRLLGRLLRGDESCRQLLVDAVHRFTGNARSASTFEELEITSRARLIENQLRAGVTAERIGVHLCRLLCLLRGTAPFRKSSDRPANK